MSEQEYRITVKQGRRFATVRYEAMQDNSPRYNVRVFRLDMSEDEWWWAVGDILTGFIFGPDGEEARVVELPPEPPPPERIWSHEIGDLARGWVPTDVDVALDGWTLEWFRNPALRRMDGRVALRASKKILRSTFQVFGLLPVATIEGESRVSAIRELLEAQEENTPSPPDADVPSLEQQAVEPAELQNPSRNNPLGHRAGEEP